jgi:hypothetical protein
MAMIAAEAGQSPVVRHAEASVRANSALPPRASARKSVLSGGNGFCPRPVRACGYCVYAPFRGS